MSIKSEIYELKAIQTDTKFREAMHLIIDKYIRNAVNPYRGLRQFTKCFEELSEEIEKETPSIQNDMVTLVSDPNKFVILRYKILAYQEKQFFKKIKDFKTESGTDTIDGIHMKMFRRQYVDRFIKTIDDIYLATFIHGLPGENDDLFNSLEAAAEFLEEVNINKYLRKLNLPISIISLRLEEEGRRPFYGSLPKLKTVLLNSVEQYETKERALLRAIGEVIYHYIDEDEIWSADEDKAIRLFSTWFAVYVLRNSGVEKYVEMVSSDVIDIGKLLLYSTVLDNLFD